MKKSRTATETRKVFLKNENKSDNSSTLQMLSSEPRKDMSQKSDEKKPEISLLADHSFLLPISSSKSSFQTLSMNNSLKTFNVSIPVQSSVSILSFSDPNTFSTLIPESSSFQTNSANGSLTTMIRSKEQPDRGKEGGQGSPRQVEWEKDRDQPGGGGESDQQGRGRQGTTRQEEGGEQGAPKQEGGRAGIHQVGGRGRAESSQIEGGKGRDQLSRREGESREQPSWGERESREQQDWGEGESREQSDRGRGGQETIRLEGWKEQGATRLGEESKQGATRRGESGEQPGKDRGEQGATRLGGGEEQGATRLGGGGEQGATRQREGEKQEATNQGDRRVGIRQTGERGKAGSNHAGGEESGDQSGPNFETVHSLPFQSFVATPPFSNPNTIPTLNLLNAPNNSFLVPTPALVPVQTNNTISFSKTVDFKLKQKLLEVIYNYLKYNNLKNITIV
jgi:hypothetical protein